MIKRLRSSLTVKIFLITAALILLSCTFTYAFIAWYMPVRYESYLGDELDTWVQGLIQELSHVALEDSRGLLDKFALDTKTDLTIYDPNGDLVKDFTFLHANTTIGNFTTTITVTEDAESGQEISEIAYGTAYSIATDYSIIFADSNAPYTMLLATNLVEVNQAVAALGNILPWLVCAILVISILGALVYSRYVTRPIVKISGISKKLSELDFQWQCDDRRTDEIGVLARSLNELSARLDASLMELRDANDVLLDDIALEKALEKKRLAFFAAVSHELKTPITVIKGQLEGMLHGIGVYKDRDTYLARTIAVAQTLEGMVQEILTVSRIESSDFMLQKETISLSQCVETVLETYVELLQQKELSVHLDLDVSIEVVADKLMLQKAIQGILSNAAHYSPPGESIAITVENQDGRARLTVLNTGASIPQEAMPHLFEAFYRVEQSRNRQTGGSGLGLYIVRMILDQHGAEYAIKNTALGVQFTLVL